MFKLRFTLAGLLVVVTVAAWTTSAFTPGGAYLHLPFGVALILAAWTAIGIYAFIKQQDPSKRTRYSLNLITSALAFTVFAGISIAWWPLWYQRYALHSSREFTRTQMNAIAIRGEGRRLLALHQPSIEQGGEQNLAPDRWPKGFRALRPSSVSVSTEVVTLRFGNLGLGNGYSLLVFQEDAKGYGTERLAPGVWLFEAGAGP